MTCIAAISDGTKVYMGADTVHTQDWSLELSADSKIIIVGPCLIASTGTPRALQLVETMAHLPPLGDMEPRRYMIDLFTSQVRDALKAGGEVEIRNGKEHGSDFLVGLAGKLFRVDRHCSVTAIARDYATLGCGADLANGSLFTSQKWGSIPDRLTCALEAAASHSAAIRPPFTYLESP